MKTPITLTTLCLLLAFSLSSCKQSSRNDYSNSELPIIDLEKEYPVKRIDIHEIADVELLSAIMHLKTIRFLFLTVKESIFGQ